MTHVIPLAVPHLGGREAEYLEECVRTNFVSSVGPFVERLEKEFAEAVGARHAVACGSGTAALHVAMLLAGSGPDTLAAVSTFTFIASANAAAYTGADLMLIDSEPDTWNMDGQRLYDEIRARAVAGRPIPNVIQVVHILGHPADLDPLMALRTEYGIAIVEDAAESLGATYTAGSYQGRQVGTIGDIGCFSFNGNKVVTTGGGGMIVTDDAALAARAKHLTTQARLPGRGYLHDDIGFNYRLSNISAALGVAQLEQLPAFLTRKREIARRYTEAFAAAPLSPPPSAAWADPTFWLYSVLLDEGAPPRDVVLDHLEEAGVQARPLWPPVHQQAPYRSADRLGGETADDIYARGISLPSSVGLPEADQKRVIASLLDVLGAA